MYYATFTQIKLFLFYLNAILVTYFGQKLKDLILDSPVSVSLSLSGNVCSTHPPWGEQGHVTMATVEQWESIGWFWMSGPFFCLYAFLAGMVNCQDTGNKMRTWYIFGQTQTEKKAQEEKRAWMFGSDQ